jgi:hypothetical protein
VTFNDPGRHVDTIACILQMSKTEAGSMSDQTNILLLGVLEFWAKTFFISPDKVFGKKREAKGR